MKEFECLAGNCRHTCCKGWEIDVDADSAQRYLSYSGDFGGRMQNALHYDGNGWSFHLDGEERCPLLNRSGLCDLILEKGKDALCQICRDHPRFYTFLNSRTETGLGLVCEAASLQTVSRVLPMALERFDFPGEAEEADEEDLLREAEVLRIRDMALETASDRTHTVRERLHMLSREGLTKEKLEKLLQLEVLDSAWPQLLYKAICGYDGFRWLPQMEVPAEQVLCYLIFRHVAEAANDGLLEERMAFCTQCTELVFRIACCLTPEPGIPEFAEAARMFSGEIEYSDVNMETLLEAEE